MTTLVVLGSGSKGNAFAVMHDGAMLLLDAGFSLRELDRRLAAGGLDPDSLVGIALTHEHGDHASGALRLAARHAVPVLASFGTWQALVRSRPALADRCQFLPVHSRAEAAAGPFAVSGCPTSHDAAEPIALGVTVAGELSIGVAYDLGRPTQAVRYFLRDRHCLILEANHDTVMLRTSGYPPAVQQRIAGPGGHLSNLDAARLLEAVHHDGLRSVVLAHVSQRCNSAAAARAVVESVLKARGFGGVLLVAAQDGPMVPVELRLPDQGSLFGGTLAREMTG
jgi:phosphoribosyl 1,2-cyclic phosphodiesterase